MNQNNTNMGMENDEITIDLMDLFQVVFKKLHLVLLAGIIAALVAVLVTKLFMTPVYTSTTKMYQFLLSGTFVRVIIKRL